jgi:hypothetical protein
MAQVRVSRVFDPKTPSECGLMHLHDYEMEEVLLPASGDRRSRKAIHFVIRGENLKAVAQPLFVLVGNEPLQFVRIAPDERSVEGVLLGDPPAGAHVEVYLGDQDAVRHPRPIDLAELKRLGPA